MHKQICAKEGSEQLDVYAERAKVKTHTPTMDIILFLCMQSVALTPYTPPEGLHG